MAPRLQFLRPYASQLPVGGTPARYSAYLRFYELAKASRSLECRSKHSSATGDEEHSAEERSALRAQRIKELLSHARGLEYPRLSMKEKSTSTRDFRAQFQNMTSADCLDATGRHCVHGRILHIRRHGSKFSFVTMIHDGVPLQVMINQRKLTDNTDPEAFKECISLLQRGDHISVSGHPALSDSGQLCIEARSLPQLYSPSIVPMPYKISEESRMQNRHLDLLINPSSREILLLRDLIIRNMREFFQQSLQCVEVQTPILAANAGGAVARPFATQATEFSHKELALRIAPELWLKRLVVAGLDRVFEIGPSFRNEGIDATHNPEFTTCEFYLAHTNLDGLLSITESLFRGLAQAVATHHQAKFPNLLNTDPKVFQSSFEQVEFIPAIEQALGRSLPDLSTTQALPDLIKILEEEGKDWHLSLPPQPSLAKLLDHIAAAVIEPQSKGRPLFILHQPVCMSPLSKSFTCPKTGQQVAARAELFYDCNELANMYEEENDPSKQRRKFVDQAKARLEQLRGGARAMDDDPAHVIDEQYISVLESGLPPTGGWGCGVDRLVMLFSGAKRISDVQPFGNLRHVVGLASAGAQGQQQGEVSDEVRENARQSADNLGQE